MEYPRFDFPHDPPLRGRIAQRCLGFGENKGHRFEWIVADRYGQIMARGILNGYRYDAPRRALLTDPRLPSEVSFHVESCPSCWCERNV